MPNPLVSVITPCYNGEKVVHRMLDSILAQTYAPIEYIFVNDGSTDHTEDVFLSYMSAFEAKGIAVKYIKQENQGLGGAINVGIKVFVGGYLCWADADDALEPESIEKRVAFLESNPQYGCVTSDAYVIYESEQHPRSLISSNFPKSQDENQFEHLLSGESIFCSGCHMVRSSAFLAVNPNRSIYPARHGQNWQLLLPVYYRYKRYFLNIPLCQYYVSPNSMSRCDDTIERKISRCDEHEEIILNALNSISMPNQEKEMYIEKTLESYTRRKIYILANCLSINNIKTQLKLIRQLHSSKLMLKIELYILVVRKIFKKLIGISL